MAISNKQKELDLIKWEKSQLLGCDACGSFNYCAHCNKEIENPCETALNVFNGDVKVEEKPAKKTTCKKTTTEKKTTTKKTTAKASKTTKKSTK
ncbi:MAG: hypothetical protein E7345_05270 [Clostridiales bacterium]|nr:hypothetical protein [Clostridiales bacterium]